MSEAAPVGVRPPADDVLKAKHRKIWASGDYPAVADEVIPQLGVELVRACNVQSGERVLDVAAGSGNASIPAAAAGAEVTASDLTPELLERGRTTAAAHGLSIDWREADAEALPFGDGEFDAVISCVGVMFAPHHQQAAQEMARVCRPGGIVGMCNWTPEGFIGRMFAGMKPYAPPPPPGAEPPPRWGNEDHVRALFGDLVTDVRAERRMLRVDRFRTGTEFRSFFAEYYGPTIAVYASLGDDQDRVQALNRCLDTLADDALEQANASMDWEYLLFTARRT